MVVDGFYHQRLGPRHKEYLYALDRGVTVIGAASIGALRALELSAFGMRGVGAVYELYRAGVFDGDDAVAVAHEGEPPYTSLSVPLVNLHAAARAACSAGLLREEEVDGVVAALRREYYPSRTPERVLRILRQIGRPELARWYGRQVAADPYVFDLKRKDCLSAVAAARRFVASGVVARVTGTEGTEWKTVFLRRWSNHFVGMAGDPPLGRRLAYQQIFNPRYARTWERYVEETHRRHQRESPGEHEGDLADSYSRKIGVARFPESSTRGKGSWLFDFICPIPDLSDPYEVELLLDAEEPSDVEAVVLHLQQAEEFARLNADPLRQESSNVLSDGASRLLLCQLWRISSDELSRECRSRGIPTVKAAVRILQPFVVGAVKGQKHRRAETA
ncbi:TfuA-like protein [Streptomyces sp. NPDC047315]|uniref:TfuA-like protein n=1 Tax=Streptomyces sp. NPDC047315 TaxID=3155142 RepID=UPI0033EB9AE0